MDSDVVFAGQGSDFPSQCPNLAVSKDRFTRCLFPTREHTCFANPRRPRRLDTDTQETLCLTPRFNECPRFAEATISAVLAGAGARTSRGPTTDHTLKLIGLVALGVSAFLFLPTPADKTDGPH